MTAIKICGVRDGEVVDACLQANVDAIGLVFVPGSPRAIDVATAIELSRQIKGRLRTVALFANSSVDCVSEVLERVRPDVLQFHGHEAAAYCAQWRWPHWKAVPMRDVVDPLAYMDDYPLAEAFIVDQYGRHHQGGSGRAFDWFAFPESHRARMILAGGLTPANVLLAMTRTGAEYVDVSSGVETAPGVKSVPLIEQFVTQVRSHGH